MQIKPAGENEIALIKNLAEVIWPEAYGEIISEEQIQYMLGLFYSVDALAAQMKMGHQFIIAYKETLPVGFASFSRRSEEEPLVFRLHKLYVLPRQHAQGIGGFLLDHIHLESIKEGATQLELNVNKYNIAKQFYEKKGFAVIKEEVIDIGDGYVMDDYVMGKDLN